MRRQVEQAGVFQSRQGLHGAGSASYLHILAGTCGFPDAHVAWTVIGLLAGEVTCGRGTVQLLVACACALLWVHVLLSSIALAVRTAHAVAAALLQVQLLLSSNDVEVDDSDYHQRTALHLAASNGHIAMVRHLVLVHGANMNVIDRWELPLLHSEP